MKAKKTLGTVAASLGFVVGFAALTSATPGGMIDTTGPDSENKIENTTSQKLEVKNDNDLKVHNDNYQSAHSGEAETEHNTTGGDATSGDAMNENSLSASATVNNSVSSAALASALSGNGAGSFDASIENTGPDSYNKIENKVTSTVEIKNDNNLSVYNDNHQTATSGDAEVSGNTTGGDASSGNASNKNETSVTFNVTN